MGEMGAKWAQNGHEMRSKWERNLANFPKIKKENFFPPPLGLLGEPDHILQNICLKPWRGFIFGPYAHFLLMKFFSKNLKFFFDFLKIQRGDPVAPFLTRYARQKTISTYFSRKLDQ